MSIESHYQQLKTTRDALAGRLDSFASRALCIADMRAVAAAATAYAAETWPETRQVYARDRHAMPKGPAVYTVGGPGYGYGTMIISIVSSNDDEHTMPGERNAHIDRGVDVARTALAAEFARADEAFDRYASLVEQGVALAPSE